MLHCGWWWGSWPQCGPVIMVEPLYPKIASGLDAVLFLGGAVVQLSVPQQPVKYQGCTQKCAHSWPDRRESDTCKQKIQWHANSQSYARTSRRSTHGCPVHTCSRMRIYLITVHCYKGMNVNERKLKPVREERYTGNCTSMSSISWRWLQTPGHT